MMTESDYIDMARRLLEYDDCQAVVTNNGESMVIALSNEQTEAELDTAASVGLNELVKDE